MFIVADIEIAVRFVHLSMLMMCFILVFFADITAAKSTTRRLTDSDFAQLHRYHSSLVYGLILLWLSGGILIFIKTGFDLSQFSPKLYAKIFVVTVLTINAVLIGQVALPFYEKNKDKRFGDFSVSVRVGLATCGALSTSSWISAFCLGSLTALKTASATTLINLLGLFYISNVLLSIIIVLYYVRPRSAPAMAEQQTLAVALLATSRTISTMDVHKAA